MDQYNMTFYTVLAKLFYAVAAIDHRVVTQEIDAFKKLLLTHWTPIEIFKNKTNHDGIEQMLATFEALTKQVNPNPENYFEEFLAFKKSNEHIFNKNLKALISKTAHAIANSFARKNKSELILLAQLDLELNKQGL
jgi:hypothetical protein